MKYYRIRHSLKDTGRKFPQVEAGVGDFNVTDSNYIGNVSHYLKKINGNVILPELVLYKSAKLTDLISSGFMGTGDGLILSNKLYTIISSYSGENQQFFKIKLHHKNLENDSYWYLHPSSVNNDLIDFSKSEVWELNSFIKDKERVFINSEEFYEESNKTKYPKMLAIDKYVLKDNCPDFFILNFIEGGIGFFVSEKLKNEIEDSGCTGIVFTESNERYP